MATHSRRRVVLGLFAAFAAALGVAGPAAGQFDQLKELTPLGPPTAASAVEKVSVSALLRAPTGNDPAMLTVVVDIQPGWHIYSLTQPKGGPIGSKIELEESPDWKLVGDFTADPEPEKHPEAAFNNLVVESHEKQVVWSAPLTLAENVDLSSVVIRGKVLVQACDASSCLLPKRYPFEAALAGLPPALEQTPEDYQAPNSHVMWRGRIEPAVVRPGATVSILLTAVPTDGYHLYAQAATDAETPGRSKPTLLVLVERPVWKSTGPLASAAPTAHLAPSQIGGLEEYYESPVAWTFRLHVPKDAQPGRVNITGMIGYMTCDQSTCDIPLAAQFNGSFEVGGTGAKEPSPLRFVKGRSYSEVSKLARQAAEGPQPSQAGTGGPQGAPGPANVDSPVEVTSREPLWYAIAIAFVGGFILNLMPCVFPVIGLKVLSLVEQAGKEHRHIYLINAVYSAGIVSVFLLLAALIATPSLKFDWGGQFKYAGFTIPMTAVIFVMALSFLGVWEIPIPGFVGGSTANKLARREGWFGTFFKGVLTTLLATPCSAPGVGAAVAWCVGQPPEMVFAVFLSMGLGMASPYLLIGTFPKLIRFLPKPGQWMETFKQLMGFVLLGTVVFFLTTLQPTYVIPTVTLLFGLWAACWWVGRVEFTATAAHKARAWATAVGIGLATYLVAFVGWDRWAPQAVSFVGMQRLMEHYAERDLAYALAKRGGAVEIQVVTDATQEIPWNPVTRATLERAISEDRPLLVDFTADWCLNCKYLEATVLNTEPVRAKLKQLAVIPMQADVDQSEAAEFHAAIGGGGVPVVAIFPPGSKTPTTVFRGVFTQGALLEKLDELQANSEQHTAQARPRRAE